MATPLDSALGDADVIDISRTVRNSNSLGQAHSAVATATAMSSLPHWPVGLVKQATATRVWTTFPPNLPSLRVSYLVLWELGQPNSI